MPIFMDVHDDLGDVTEDDIKNAHQQDLAVQDEYGVQFLTYWFNNADGQAFCLVDAPSKEAAVAVHKASHGLVPHDMQGRPTSWSPTRRRQRRQQRSSCSSPDL